MSFTQLIEDNPVVVFSKITCPYSAKTKKVITSLGFKFTTVELDQVENGDEIEAQLQKETKLNSTPYVFVSKKCIGDNKDIQILHKENKLIEMLKTAGAKEHFNNY